MSHHQPEILSASQPNFQLLTSNLSYFIVAKLDDRVTSSSSLFWHHYDDKQAVPHIYSESKECVLENFVWAPPPNFLFPSSPTFSTIHVAVKTTIFRLEDNKYVTAMHCAL